MTTILLALLGVLAISGWCAFWIAQSALSDLAEQRNDIAHRYVICSTDSEERKHRAQWVQERTR